MARPDKQKAAAKKKRRQDAQRVRRERRRVGDEPFVDRFCAIASYDRSPLSERLEMTAVALEHMVEVHAATGGAVPILPPSLVAAGRLSQLTTLDPSSPVDRS